MRLKKMLHLLSGFGVSLDYTRLLKLDAQIANFMLEWTALNDDVYTPRSPIPGKHIFFAIDNSDFSKDTPDGTNTLHGMTKSLYKKCKENDMVLVPPTIEIKSFDKFQVLWVHSYPKIIYHLSTKQTAKESEATKP